MDVIGNFTPMATGGYSSRRNSTEKMAGKNTGTQGSTNSLSSQPSIRDALSKSASRKKSTVPPRKETESQMKVLVRVRPVNKMEMNSDNTVVVTAGDDKTLQVALISFSFTMKMEGY